MNKQNNLQEEKRAAFKRFAKMGTAGLAVLSMSAFTDLSGKQLPANVETGSIEELNSPLAKLLTDTIITIEGDTIYSETDTIEGRDLYGDGHNDYYNYGNNYTEYSNAGYSNHYSNYCDAQ